MMRYDDYQTMMGGSGWGFAPFMWITYLLIITILVLAIMALWKYINKK